MKKIIVPDASVLLKWAFNDPSEPDRDNALTVLTAWLDGRIDIILPKLWSFEVGNILMLKNPALAVQIMEIFIGYNFDELDMTPELCRESFKLMKKYKVTFYDASYHAVALICKGLFLTADESYFRKANGMGSVMKLKDWI